MTHFKSIMLAGAIAVSGAVTATDADALGFPLSGDFIIEAYNYNPTTTALDGTADGATKSQNSRASIDNFLDISSGSSFIGTNIARASIFYTGAIDFDFRTSPQTIEGFLDSGSGSYVKGTGVGELDVTDANSFGKRTLSAGSYSTATLFKITATSLNIGDLGNLLNVFHDDGITVTGATGIVTSVNPTTRKETKLFNELTGGAADFTLYYAAANSNPSILEVNAIPLPAAAWLLLGVSGALVAAKRRSARRDA